jgi:multidrug efflux pump subunit AcrA (membrane-fusion protein)
MHIDRKYIFAGIAVVLTVLLLIFKPWGKGAEKKVRVKVEKGTFETYISEVGELKAKKSLDILIPEIAFRRELDIWQMKILDIVEEGKIVRKGDHVATLDPTDIEEEMSNNEKNLDDYLNRLETAKLDSSLTLAAARDAIQKAKDVVLDNEIKVEQSVYESKAVQRQAKLELEQAQRSYARAKRDLEQRRRKLKTTIARYERKVKKYQKRKDLYMELRSQLDIKSPADGMVIYGEGYEGKIRVGSHVGRWAPLIATLPDLSTLMSEIYVKEVNIAKVSKGDKVRIKIDAFPDREFTGKVTKIANIGQEIPGEYQNGFKVEVTLDPYHVELLPGMTTANEIITGTWDDVLMVPKSAVLSADSVSCVIRVSGLTTERAEITIGAENEESFMITSGLDEGDVILADPQSAEK